MKGTVITMAKNEQNKHQAEQNVNDCRNSKSENNVKNGEKTENKAQNTKMQNKK